MKPLLLALALLSALHLQAEDRKATIQVVEHLDFGGLLVQPAGGRLTLTAEGDLVPEGGGLQGAPPPRATPARFRITGPPRGRFVVRVDPPSPMLTRPRGGQVRVAAFQGPRSSLEGTFDGTGQAEVRLGGTLDVAAGVPGGLYMGTQAMILVRVLEAGWGTSHESFRIQARLRAPLTLQCTKPLQFAGLLPGSLPGSVTVAPTGGFRASGASAPMLLSGTPQPAAFLLTGPAGTDYQIQLPARTTLTGPGGHLQVDGFTTEVRPGGCLPEGGLRFHVGATLHLAPGLARGEYKGLFQVTVIYP